MRKVYAACQWFKPASALRRAALTIVSCALGAVASPLMGQIIGNAATASTTSCHVIAVNSDESGQKRLLADCGGRGVSLGLASDFTVFANQRLDATLVDARLEGERRILLVSRQEDGEPLVEDLGGELALAAGRGPMSPLADVDLDLEKFGSTGEIGVHGRPEDTGSAKADSINIGRQIVAERSRRSGREAKQ